MPTGSRGSSLPAPPRAVRRRALSPAVMTVFSLVGAALVVASNSAVTPLYRLYQQSMHLTPLMITLVYAVYTFSLLAALLTVGGLSDYVGRRPVILSGLLLNAIAMVLFSYATDVGQLILARAVQGLCVGTATTALGAAILDTDRRRGPLLNSVTAFLALTALMMVLLFVMPETVSRKAGVLASLRPRVSVPRQSRAALLRITPASIAAWAFGGFYLSLMPTVVATTLGVRAPWVGGIVVAAPWLSAALTVGALRQLAARRLLVLGTGALSLGVVASLLGIWQHSVAALFAGAVIAGLGLGASLSGSLSALLPTAEAHQRAGLLATFYVLSYLALGLPALVAGASVPLIGLDTVAYVYGAVVIVLAIISMIASLRSIGNAADEGDS